MSATEPLISVVMTTYSDNFDRLRRSVDSILSQTMHDLELIVAFEPDDPNADALVKSCIDPRLLVLKNPIRAGKAVSFNHCLAKARGRYIARMDSDDRAYPDRFEKQLAYLSEHPDVAVLGGGVTITDEDGNAIAVRKMAPDHASIVRNFALMNAMCHPTILWDRDKVGADLLYDERFSVEDLELWFRLLRLGHRFANLNAPLIEYKQTAQWRRPMRNWHGNLRVRIVYWRLMLRYPILSVGILAFAVLAVLPKSVVDRLTRRGILTDSLRSIRPTQSPMR